MVSKTFESGDLVWAKMKGYSPWPGKIMAPPKDAKPKPKKISCHYVFFFGSENHAWIPDDCIESHSEQLLQKYGNKKGSLFRTAVDTIIDCSRQGVSKDPKSKESSEEQPDEQEEDEGSVDEEKSVTSNRKSKVKKSQSNNSGPKKSKSFLKKVVSPKPYSYEEKILRKQSSDQSETSESQSESESSSLKSESAHSISSVSVCSMTSKTENTHSPPSVLPDSERSRFGCKNADIYNMFENKNSLLTDQDEQQGPKKYYECPAIPPIDLLYQSEFFKKKKIEPTKKKIGFIGLDVIGQAIVKHLYHSGHSVTIWDSTPSKYEKFKEKVKVAPTAHDVVKMADITFCCLSDSEIARDLIVEDSSILKEIEHSNRVKKGYVEMTPLDPRISQQLASEIRMKGGRYLEAPITGSISEAIESTLLIITAGDKTLYDDCKSCLDAISNKHMFISAEVGAAAKLNIVNNMFSGTVYGALAEALHLSCSVGLPIEHFYEFLKLSGLHSNNLLQKIIAMTKHNYTTEIALKQMQSEFNLGLLLGNDISKHTTIMAAANEVYKYCKLLKYDEHDVSAVFEAVKP